MFEYFSIGKARVLVYLTNKKVKTLVLEYKFSNTSV